MRQMPKRNPKCVTQVWVFSYSRGWRKWVCLVVGKVWAWSYQLSSPFVLKPWTTTNLLYPMKLMCVVCISLCRGLQGSGESWPNGEWVKFHSVHTTLSQTLLVFLSCLTLFENLMEVFSFDKAKAFPCNFIFVILRKYFSKVEIL